MEKAAYVAKKLGLPLPGVAAALALFGQDATVPFVARYRREVTGGLLEGDLRNIQAAGEAFDALAERKETVLKTLADLKKLTPALAAQIESVDSLPALEDLYRPYKPKRETKGSKAVKAGLSPLLDFILSDRTGTLKETAKAYVSKDYPTPEDAIEGALAIWAEKISDQALYRHWIANQLLANGRVEANLTKKKDGEADKSKGNFDFYDKYSRPLKSLKSFNVLALERGSRAKALRLSFSFPKAVLFADIQKREKPVGFVYPKLLETVVEDACERLIFPSVENQVWGQLVEKAKTESLGVFASGVKQVLMAPPLVPQAVMGFDPGYAHGCKIAVISSRGDVLDTAVVFPTVGSGTRQEAAGTTVLGLVKKDNVKAVALGNGTAFRESYDFLTGLFKANGLSVPVVSVSESGASVYSATPLAEAEFPDYDVNLRSAVSIARRLLDPLAELVKIPPESLGVGQYQHDLDQKVLSATLSDVVEDCVAAVGVDANTASAPLLAHVSGLTKKTAQGIVDLRMARHGFKSRSEIKDVKGIGPKAYQNAIGFLRIPGGDPLDDTFIHPESYPIARKAMAFFRISNREDAAKVKAKLTNPDLLKDSQTLGTDPYTLAQILEELSMPHRDPRGTFQAPVLSEAVRDIKDLKPGMRLQGVVRNVADFGCFVDLGIHKDGLVHVSEIGLRPGQNVHSAVSIGQIVDVVVLSVDLDRERIGLSMKAAQKEKA